MESAKRREHNTKRVGQAFRGKESSSEISGIRVVPKGTKNEYTPSSSPRANEQKHVSRQHEEPKNPRPKDDDYKGKPSGGISPKPKPKNPGPNTPSQFGAEKEHEKQMSHKSAYTLTRKK